LAFLRLPIYGQLMAVGSDDRAAFSAGVHVIAVRWIAYALGGAFAGAAALSLTALIGSADPNVGPNYTLLAISSAALGGVSLAGGRGGLLGAAIGGLNIFLLQSLLTFFNVSTFVLQVAYGAILVAAVSVSPLQERFVARARR
jgi:ribose transport system permease protein